MSNDSPQSSGADSPQIPNASDQASLLIQGDWCSSGVRKLALDIHHVSRWEELGQVVTSGLRDLFGAVAVRWIELTADGMKILRSEISFSEGADEIQQNLVAMMQRSVELGGFTEKIKSFVTGEDGLCMLSDFWENAQLETCDWYVDYLQPHGVRDLVGFPGWHSDAGLVIVILGLRTRGIHREALDNLLFIRENIRVACDKLLRMASHTNLSSALNSMRKSDGAVGLCVIAPDGGKVWDVDAVSKLLLRELGADPKTPGDDLVLPGVISDWVMPRLNDERSLCAGTTSHTRTFHSPRGVVISAHLYVEQIGRGGVLVLQEQSKAGELDGIFTRREQDVIRCLLRGMPSQETAQELAISKRTVDKHLENIYTKLGVSNRLAAVGSLQELKGVVGK